MKNILFLIAFFPIILFGQLRADQLPEITDPAGTDAFYSAERGSFQKITLARLQTLFESGVDYVVQTTAPTDTTKLWLDTATYPLTKYNVLRQRIDGAWRIQGYYNTISNQFRREKPILILGIGQSQIFGQQNTGDTALDSLVIQFNNTTDEYVLSRSIRLTGASYNTPQFQAAKNFAAYDDRMVTIQTTALGGQSIAYFEPGGAGWDSLVVNMATAGFSEWEGADYVVFGQGESDADGSGVCASFTGTECDSVYLSHVYNLFQSLRDSGYVKTKAPIVSMGMVNPGVYTDRDYILSTLNYDDDIRTGYVSGKGLSSFDGGTHFAGTAVDTLGERYYWRFKNMQSKYDFEPSLTKVGDDLIFNFNATKDTVNITPAAPVEYGIETLSDSTLVIDLDGYQIKKIEAGANYNTNVSFSNFASNWGKEYVFHFVDAVNQVRFSENLLYIPTDGVTCLVDTLTSIPRFAITAYADSANLYIMSSTTTLTCRELEPEYQEIIDYATLQGYTLPSDVQQRQQNRLLAAMKTSGMWDKQDVFYNFATNGDENFALINWKAPGTNNATNVNSSTFTPNEGFTGNGTSSYINTNYNASTEGVNYVLDDASLTAWVNLGVSGKFAVGTTAGARNWIQIAPSNNNMFSVNSGASTNFTGGNISTLGNGMRSAHRTSSTNNTYFVDETAYPRTQTSGSIANSDYFVNRVSSLYGANQVSMVAFGSSYVTEYPAFYEAWLNYFNNL